MADTSEKKCAVCGDIADCFNFGVLSCVSCKAFFRRNALIVKQMKCPFNEKCEITRISRKFCSKCRLKKCFDVGMIKELILSDEQKQNRKNRKLQKQKNTKQIIESETVVQTVVDSTTQISSDFSNTIDDQFISEILKDNTLNDEDIEAQVKELKNCITDQREDEISPDIYRKCLELDFAVMPVLRPITDYQNNFNEVEGSRLTELLTALNAMKCSFGEITSKADNWGNHWMVAMADEFGLIVKRLVQTSKSLTFFTELPEDDKIILLKYGAVEIVVMRKTLAYDCTTRSLKVSPRGNQDDCTLVYLETIKSDSQYLYDAYLNFFERLGVEWDSDPNIIDLLTAIVFYNPDRPKLSQKESIRYQQYVYMYLLKRYLQLRYRSESVSTTKFLKLMNTMKYLREIYVKHIQLYQYYQNNDEPCPEETSQCDTEQLIHEFFNFQI